MYHNPCTLYMHYGLLPPHKNNIVNSSIKSKTRGRMRFGLTMIKYTFYVTTSQIGGGDQGDTQKDFRSDIQTNLILQIGILMVKEHLPRVQCNWINYTNPSSLI